MQIRQEDSWTRQQVALVNDVNTQYCVTAERSFLQVLDGTCRTPIAGLAEIVGDDLLLRGQVLDPQGAQTYDIQKRAPCDPNDLDQARAFGATAGAEMLERAGPSALKV